MTEAPSGILAVDVVIIVAYLMLLAGIGYYFSRKQKSLETFIRGGGKVGWLALGVSLMAALNSGLDYIQAPAVVFAIGVVYIMSFVSWIILYPWVSRVTLPFYQRLDVYSAYEYLERRFGLRVRLVGASIFILWRVGWMGAAIYVPCLAVQAATGGQIAIAPMVICLGVVVTLYTMFGGMEAVVWTDVAQFCIMFGGLAATLYTVVSQIPGGLSEVFQIAYETGRLSPVGQTVPADGLFEWLGGFFTTEVTFTGIVLAVLLGKATAFTADQIAIQRFQTARSLDAARRSYVVNAVTDTIWMAVLAGVGLALFAYFQHFPFPEGIQNDRVLPYFMLHHFPTGVLGLVIAAIFAASLSSVDSALNSSASVIVVDFYNRLWLGRKRPLANLDAGDQRRQLRVSRLATLGLGALMILIGTNIENMGELYQACNKIIGAFFGPLFGIFVLGMFSRKAHSLGVMIGSIAGLCSSCFASFFSELPGLQTISGRLFGDEFVRFFQDLSWQWPSPIGVTVTLTVGYLASRVIRRQAPIDPPLTFAEVMKLPQTGPAHAVEPDPSAGQ